MTTTLKLRKGKYTLHNYFRRQSVPLPIEIRSVTKARIEYSSDYNLVNEDQQEPAFKGTPQEELGYDPFLSDFTMDEVEKIEGRNIYLKTRA
jgi:hypothetical protein